jgi:hypothetical protein
LLQICNSETGWKGYFYNNQYILRALSWQEEVLQLPDVMVAAILFPLASETLTGNVIVRFV